MVIGIRNLTLSLIACISLLNPGLLFADQDGLRGDNAEQFSVFAISNTAMWKELRYLPTADTGVALDFEPNRRSKPIEVANTAAGLSFGFEKIDPKSQEKHFVPAVHVDWPRGAQKVLVLFEYDPDKKQVRAVAMDDGPNAFPAGSARVYNASGISLLSSIGDFKGSVPLGLSPSYEYSLKKGTYQLAFARNDLEEGPLVVYNHYLYAWPTKRTLAILYPHKLGEPEMPVRSLVDSPPKLSK